MKKKKDSSSEDFIGNFGTTKNKVMPSLLAEEIDAEPQLDSVGSDELEVNSEEDLKTTWRQSPFGELDLERVLYRWYERLRCQSKEVSSESKTVPSLKELIKKAKSLCQKLNESSGLTNTVTKSWILRWQEKYGIPKNGDDDSDSLSNISDDSMSRKKSFEEEKKLTCLEPIKQRLKKRRLKKEDNEITTEIKSNRDSLVTDQIEDLRQVLSVDTEQEQEIFLQKTFQNNVIEEQHDFGNDQIYFAFSFEFNWTSLPDKTWTTLPENSVWLLMAANRSGRHRTRILVTGHEWRPQCLKYVNMVSQPVVYAGGGKGVLTPDLFNWWLLKEFMPAAESLNSEFTLFAEDKWLNLKSNEVKKCKNVRVLPVSKSEIVDWDLIYAEFKTRFTTFLLKNLANTAESVSPTSLVEYLKEFSLKDAFPLFHKSWLSIRSESFQRLSEIKLIDGERRYSVEFPTGLGMENSLSNFTKGESKKIESEFKSVNLTTDGKCEKKEPPRLALTSQQTIASNHLQEDRLLLLELQWLAHDIGLEVTDEDMSSWVLDRKTVKRELVKIEDADFSFEDVECPIKASEAAECLKKALMWMETQPIDSNLLMTVRDVMDLAKQASKMGLAPPHPGAPLHFFCHNGDHLTNPPPAHMGIPPYHLDAKGTGAMGEYWRGLSLGGLSIRPPSSGPSGSPVPPHPAFSPQDWKRLGPLLAASGLSRTPMYSFPAGSTYPYPMLSPEMSQVPATWHTPGMYPISAGAGFRSSYTPSLPISSTTLPSDFYRFSPTSLLPGHPGLSPHGHHSLSSHPAIVTPGPKQELGHHTQSDHNHRSSSLDHKNSSSSHHSTQDSKTQDSSSQNDKKKPHIKKPLNAFMLYMKEMRAKVVAECTLKESAAINQILGRRWHALGREEQAKYYELARRERQLHMQLYPDWSSRANSSRGKKRKRKQETNDGGNNMKKCRARYGLDQQSQWCKPCRRKKKCIRYLESGEERDGNQSEDNLGSCGSVGEARTPPDDDESLPHSLSSPGGLSGLSSLTSPSMILPSPSTSLASPSVSLASPCMSLQSPLTPPTFDMKPIMPIALPPLNRNPVGTNPHDVNNPLSVNQLTGKCIKSEPKEQSRPISVT